MSNLDEVEVQFTHFLYVAFLRNICLPRGCAGVRFSLFFFNSHSVVFIFMFRAKNGYDLPSASGCCVEMRLVTRKAAWRTSGRRLRPQPGPHPAGHGRSEIPEILIGKAFRLVLHFSLMNNAQL